VHILGRHVSKLSGYAPAVPTPFHEIGRHSRPRRQISCITAAFIARPRLVLWFGACHVEATSRVRCDRRQPETISCHNAGYGCPKNHSVHFVVRKTNTLPSNGSLHLGAHVLGSPLRAGATHVVHLGPIDACLLAYQGSPGTCRRRQCLHACAGKSRRHSQKSLTHMNLLNATYC
jgi:hypothetical protein